MCYPRGAWGTGENGGEGRRKEVMDEDDLPPRDAQGRIANPDAAVGHSLLRIAPLKSSPPTGENDSSTRSLSVSHVRKVVMIENES